MSETTVTCESMAVADVQAKALNDRSAAALLAHAARAGGRSVWQVARDFWALHRGPGKLTLQEYVLYGLYDDARFSAADKSRFLSNSLHWPLTSDCCDRTWDAVTEDKFLSGTMLEAAGLPVAQTVAVIDAGARDYGRTPRLDSPAALRDFLMAQEMPLFGKVLRGICSFGAFVITGADAQTVRFADRAPLSHADVLGRVLGDTPYLLQRVLPNHPFLDGICSATATVRMVNMVGPERLLTPAAVLKLPGAGNIADAFWRKGNLACDLDPATGEIRTITGREGLNLVDHAAHPSGRKLIGERLPLWDALLELNARAARLFEPVRYQSFDIALTPGGPVIVEINTGGGFDLPQHAGRRGLGTEEALAFFRACGSTRV